MNRKETFKGKRWFVRLKRAILWLVLGVLGLALLGSLYQMIGTALDRRAMRTWRVIPVVVSNRASVM